MMTAGRFRHLPVVRSWRVARADLDRRRRQGAAGGDPARDRGAAGLHRRGLIAPVARRSVPSWRCAPPSPFRCRSPSPAGGCGRHPDLSRPLASGEDRPPAGPARQLPARPYAAARQRLVRCDRTWRGPWPPPAPTQTERLLAMTMPYAGREGARGLPAGSRPARRRHRAELPPGRSAAPASTAAPRNRTLHSGSGAELDRA